MVYRGKVHNGTIVLEKGVMLEEGLTVSIRPLRPRTTRGSGKKKRIPTLYERFKPIIGIAKGLPPDLSTQIDHYLYGTPKRK
jgi:hypothetical protein